MAKDGKASKSKSVVTHKGISMGKLADSNQHMGPLSHKGAKGKHSPQVSGHVDHAKEMHDAKGHSKGSRGPFTTAEKGKHKAKD